MASEKQIAANRANALKSTGPRTADGKAISRRNALTHGLRAEQLMLASEDPALFERLREALFDQFAPETVYEEQLADQLAGLIWRLKRVPVFEAAMLDWMGYRQEEIHDRDRPAEADPRALVTVIPSHRGLSRTTTQHDQETRARLKLGRLLEAESEKTLMATLTRYEAHLMRQLKQTRKELDEVQTDRLRMEAAQGVTLLATSSKAELRSDAAAPTAEDRYAVGGDDIEAAHSERPADEMEGE